MEEKVLMTPEQLVNGVKDLAGSQGMYGRIYKEWNIRFSPEELEIMLDELIMEYNIRDMVDFVMLVEG